MISRSHITKKGTRIEVLKLPSKVRENSTKEKYISINNKKDNGNKESSDEETADNNKQEEESDLNCQLFWHMDEDNVIDDHVEFDNDDLLIVRSEIDVFDNVF